MSNLFILYPNEFNCYSKFERKVNRLTSNLKDLNIYFLNDSNLMIQKFSKDNDQVSNLHQITDWHSMDFSYAIVFDDGEEFIDECIALREREIPFRVIKIAITRVINIKLETEFETRNDSSNYCYIGRGSYWGNPHAMYENGDTREDVIRKYKYDFDFDKFINKEKNKVYELQGKRLGCFCKPELCHGDILANYLNSWDDGK